MKNTISSTFSIFMLLTILSGTSNIAAAADTYLGDYCWLILAEGEPVEEGSVYKLGLFYKGGNHFALSGVWDVDQAVHGNMEVIGNIVSVTLFGSADYGNAVVSETVKATLNNSTLSGPAHALGIEVDLTTEVVENFYVPHTMTFIGCP